MKRLLLLPTITTTSSGKIVNLLYLRIVLWTIMMMIVVADGAGSGACENSVNNNNNDGGGGEEGKGECSVTANPTSRPSTSISYILLAVSGTLEEGFELRPNMDYRPTNNDDDDDGSNSRVNATFLGKALVRGYKSFLDIKNPTWREYKNDPTVLKTVNPAVVPTGCHEHANRYAIYAVDVRQAMNALSGEPRFLSIAPDMGLTDLTAADDLTYPDIKLLARAYATTPSLSGISSNSSTTADTATSSTIQDEDDEEEEHTREKINLDQIAFLTVTSTWFKSTFVANGILRNDKDGSITDYAESTGIWSRTILNPHGSVLHDRYPEGCGSDPQGGQVTNVTIALDYKQCIDAAIRRQEATYTTTTTALSGDDNVGDGQQQQQQQQHLVGDHAAYEFCAAPDNTRTDGEVGIGSKACYPCQSSARYGTDPYTARFNKVLTACQLEDLMVSAGVINEDTGGPKFPLQGCSLL